MAKAKKKSPTKKPRTSPAGQSSNHPSGARFTAAELEHIADRIIRWSGADETEVEIDATVDALTRFANNTIHQNVAEHTLGISVRAVVDGRTARATTNKTDEESLRRVARRRRQPRAQPTRKSRSAADARPAEISESLAFLSFHRRGHAARSRPRRRARLQDGG